MRLSKRELIMLIMLIIVAVIFIEYRFVIIPGIEEYDRLMSEKQAAEAEIQTIELNMAIAKQNESKRDENISQIKQLAEKFFDELKMDALLVRTHDLILEQGLSPQQYLIQQIQSSPLVPDEYAEVELTYELKNLAKAYWLITGQEMPKSESPNTDDNIGNDQIEQYQISMNAIGTYTQLNNFLDAVHKLQRSIVVASLSLQPDTAVIPEILPEVPEPGATPTPTPTPPVVLPSPEETDEQLLSIQITLYYYGLVKLIPTDDAFNEWYREPFTPVAYSPFKNLPVPVETLPTEPVESVPTESTGN